MYIYIYIHVQYIYIYIYSCPIFYMSYTDIHKSILFNICATELLRKQRKEDIFHIFTRGGWCRKKIITKTQLTLSFH